MSLLGCSWCSYHSSGQEIEKPYCAEQVECYLGVEGMPNPYKEYDDDDDDKGECFISVSII